jgi:hypothetical protein
VWGHSAGCWLQVWWFVANRWLEAKGATPAEALLQASLQDPATSRIKYKVLPHLLPGVLMP